MSAEQGPRRMRVVTAVVLFVVFVAGLATGAAVVHLTGPRFHHPPGPPAMALRGIDLSPEQRARVDAIWEKYRPRIDAIMRETFPRVRAAEDEMNRELRAELKPEQQKRFDDNEAHRPPFPPSPGGPPPFGPGGEPPHPGPP